MNVPMRLTSSFYAPTPKAEEADDLFQDYLAFLTERNGALDGTFHKRDAMMDDLAADTARFDGRIDAERFKRNYGAFRERDVSREELALLTFVKMNAGEAYGVEVTSKARAHLMARDEPIFRTERVLTQEETYHTKMLLGATQHFEGVEVGDAWRPAWPLRVLIFCLAKFPPTLFHPMLLGSEIAGVFTFNWMLERLGTLFPDDPAVRESMERRLIEVLIDEVGHIAYNRIAVPQAGMPVVKSIAAAVLRGTETMTPEMNALGLDAEARRGLDRFDLADLPEEVRRRAFFV